MHIFCITVFCFHFLFFSAIVSTYFSKPYCILELQDNLASLLYRKQALAPANTTCEEEVIDDFDPYPPLPPEGESENLIKFEPSHSPIVHPPAPTPPEEQELLEQQEEEETQQHYYEEEEEQTMAEEQEQIENHAQFEAGDQTYQPEMDDYESYVPPVEEENEADQQFKQEYEAEQPIQQEVNNEILPDL